MKETMTPSPNTIAVDYSPLAVIAVLAIFFVCAGGLTAAVVIIRRRDGKSEE